MQGCADDFRGKEAKPWKAIPLEGQNWKHVYKLYTLNRDGY